MSSMNIHGIKECSEAVKNMIGWILPLELQLGGQNEDTLVLANVLHKILDDLCTAKGKSIALAGDSPEVTDVSLRKKSDFSWADASSDDESEPSKVISRKGELNLCNDTETIDGDSPAKRLDGWESIQKRSRKLSSGSQSLPDWTKDEEIDFTDFERDDDFGSSRGSNTDNEVTSASLTEGENQGSSHDSGILCSQPESKIFKRLSQQLDPAHTLFGGLRYGSKKIVEKIRSSFQVLEQPPGVYLRMNETFTLVKEVVSQKSGKDFDMLASRLLGQLRKLGVRGHLRTIVSYEVMSSMFEFFSLANLASRSEDVFVLMKILVRYRPNCDESSFKLLTVPALVSFMDACFVLFSKQVESPSKDGWKLAIDVILFISSVLDFAPQGFGKPHAGYLAAVMSRFVKHPFWDSMFLFLEDLVNSLLGMHSKLSNKNGTYDSKVKIVGQLDNMRCLSAIDSMFTAVHTLDLKMRHLACVKHHRNFVFKSFYYLPIKNLIQFLDNTLVLLLNNAKFSGMFKPQKDSRSISIKKKLFKEYLMFANSALALIVIRNSVMSISVIEKTLTNEKFSSKEDLELSTLNIVSTLCQLSFNSTSNSIKFGLLPKVLHNRKLFVTVSQIINLGINSEQPRFEAFIGITRSRLFVELIKLLDFILNDFSGHGGKLIPELRVINAKLNEMKDDFPETNPGNCFHVVVERLHQLFAKESVDRC